LYCICSVHTLYKIITSACERERELKRGRLKEEIFRERRKKESEVKNMGKD
jgi:hypothetical protein